MKKIIFIIITIYIFIQNQNVYSNNVRFGLEYQYRAPSERALALYSKRDIFALSSFYSFQFGYEKILSYGSAEILTKLETKFYDISYIEDDYLLTTDYLLFQLPINLLLGINFIQTEKYRIYLKTGPLIKFLLYEDIDYKRVRDDYIQKRHYEFGLFFSSIADTLLFAYAIKPGLDIKLSDDYFLYLQLPFELQKGYDWEYKVGFDIGVGFSTSDNDPFNSKNISKDLFCKNSIFIEALGNGILYSLNYDHLWNLTKFFKLSSRIGFTVLPLKGGIIGFPMEINYLFGRDKHFFELGTGLNLFFGNFSEPYGNWRIGYRYQKSIGGFFFRAGIVPLFEMNRIDAFTDVMPSIGFSFGLNY